jgi:EmrB/QacA subfamily drug resistance transporter
MEMTEGRTETISPRVDEGKPDEPRVDDDKPDGEVSWMILVVLALAQFMLVVDATIVNIALPSIQHTFKMTDANLQWIVTAYALTFGGFLLLGGRSADLFGRKLTFMVGLVVFTLASLGSGLSNSGDLLIVFRAFQGLAGAFMSPAALSIVLVTYSEGATRNTALAIWGAVAAAGGALGVLLGGIFTQYLGWRWNFFINIPIGVIVFTVAMRLIPSYSPGPGKKNLDLLGATLVTGGLIALVYGLAQAPTWGWASLKTIICFTVAVVALVGFVVNERIVKQPLMPLRIFKIGNVAGADSLMLLISAGVFSAFFFGTLYIQEILGFSAIKAGVSFTIIPLCIAIAATTVPKLVKRIGFRPILIGAPMLVGAGLFYLSGIPLEGKFWTDLAPGFAMIGLGMGATFVTTTIAATSGVPGTLAGLSSGLITTSQQIGGAIGLGALTSIVTSSISRYFKGIYVPGTSKGLATVESAVHGFQVAFLIGGFVAISAALLAIVLIQQPQPAKQRQEDQTREFAGARVDAA